MTRVPEWTDMFDAYGIKKVSKTDKVKSAYVVNKRQREVIEGAGVRPEIERGFPITILFDDHKEIVEASFYHSERVGAGRAVEPRMGLAFISSWLEMGDRLFMGRIGAQLFAAKLAAAPTDAGLAVQAIIDEVHPEDVLRKAALSTGRPSRRTVKTLGYVRNQWVIRAAILRSGGACEMPDCRRELFWMDNGSRYLEVHHITPLSENGDDSLRNVAALCPSCHRELHFGSNRHELTKRLEVYIFSHYA